MIEFKGSKRKGQIAFKEGKTSGENPYEENTAKFYDWLAGYHFEMGRAEEISHLKELGVVFREDVVLGVLK